MCRMWSEFVCVRVRISVSRTVCSREERLASKHLGHYAAHGPHVHWKRGMLDVGANVEQTI